MKNFGFLLSSVMFPALCLSACGKRESAAPLGGLQDRSSPAAAAPAAVEKTPASGPHEGSNLTGGKPLPKLVLVTPLADRTDDRRTLFQSTVQAAGTSVVIIQNAAPGVQGTAAPAAPTPAQDPKKPTAQPVY